jgi:hypothetical protein
MQRHSRPRLIVLLAAVASLAACGPLGPFPGGRLRGEVHQGAPPDWSIARDAKQIQLETRPEDPYSVNVWCGVMDGKLYVPTSLILGTDDPAERGWVKNVQEDPGVRVRIEGTVYPLRAVRVDDPAEREAARKMLLAKYEVEADEHATAAWIFRLDP